MEVKEKPLSIVKINPAQYGLTETKAKEIEAMFSPMLDKMVELESEFNEIAKLKVSKETCIIARELRLKYVKVRTGTAEIHKGLKAFYLNGGRFVDGWKNAQLFASQGIEEKLIAIENYYENIEKKRIAKLQETRAIEMMQYEVDYIPDNLGQMPDDVWQNLITGTKVNYQARVEAEQKAEADRIEAERKAEKEIQEQIILDKRESDRREKILPYREYWQGIVDAGTLRDLSDDVFETAFKKIVAAQKEDNEKQKQIQKENERLRKEAEQREKAEAERLAKAEAERKIKEEKEAKEKAAYEAKLQEEREQREKAEAELRAKAEAEERARIEAERIAAAQERTRKKEEKATRLAPDKKKLEKLAIDIRNIPFPEVKNQEAFKLIQIVKNQLNQVITSLQTFES